MLVDVKMISASIILVDLQQGTVGSKKGELFPMS